MFQLLKTFTKGYENYMTQVGRQRARQVLLMQGQRELEDMGISRHLLLQGVQAWPWRDESAPTKVEQPAPATRLTRAQRRAEKQAIRTLRSLSDAELRDMGVSRGGIVDAVRHGRRDDLERTPIVPRRLRTTLKDAKTDEINTQVAASNETDDNPPLTPQTGGSVQKNAAA